MEQKAIYDIHEVLKILPHRYPFLLIDKVVEFEDNIRILAVKNVTINEPYFMGHFPELPVMPGVMLLEAMAQAGAILATKSADGLSEGKNMFLAGANNVRWKKQVTPGDTLKIEMTHVWKRRPLWCMDGKITVEGKVVAQATITAAEVG